MIVPIYRTLVFSRAKVWQTTISLVCAVISIFLGSAFFMCDRACADSEASSEAGLEAPIIPRRRGRRFVNQAQTNQQTRQDQTHERQVRQSTAREDKRLMRINGRNTTHTYGDTKKADRLLDAKAYQSQPVSNGQAAH